MDRLAFEQTGKRFGLGFRFQLFLIHLHGLILEWNNQKPKGGFLGNVDLGIKFLSPFLGESHLSAPELF